MQVERLQAAINSAKDAMFADFSAKVGVENVREYETAIEAKLAEREERLAQLNRQIAELTTESDSLTRTLGELDSKIARDQEQIDVRTILSGHLLLRYSADNRLRF